MMESSDPTVLNDPNTEIRHQVAHLLLDPYSYLVQQNVPIPSDLKDFIHPTSCNHLIPNTWAMLAPDSEGKGSDARLPDVPNALELAVKQHLTLLASQGEGEAALMKIFEMVESKDLLEKAQPCGRTFRKGDLVYRCVSCEMDPTCVLCVTCFKGQDHSGHETYIHVSKGGGMCDCGDAEAWKTVQICEVHGRCEPLHSG